MSVYHGSHGLGVHMKPTGAGAAAAGLLALAVAIGIGRFAFTPLLPVMQEDAGLSVAAGAWLASANYVGYLVGALSAMAIRVRPVSAIRGGLIATSLATVAMGLEDRFAAWLALRALAGIASAWVLVHVSAWSLGQLAPLRRPLLAGVVFAGVGAGIMSVGLICIVLMHAGAGSARGWIVFGMFSFFLSAIAWRGFGTGDRDSQAGGQPEHVMAGRRSEAGRLVFSYFALGFGYIIPATFLPVMAREAIGDPAIFGWSWPVFGLAAGISTVVAALLAESVGNRRLWIASQFLMALGVAVPVFMPGIWGILMSALFVGGTFMVITMAGLKEARTVGDGSPARLMAAMTAAFALGQIAGPIAVSYAVGANWSFSVPLVTASLLLAAGACAVMPGASRAAAPVDAFDTRERKPQ